MPSIDLMPAPSIMAGVSERPARRTKLVEPKAPALSTTLADIAPLPTPLPALDFGVTSCAGELARIANYAAAVAQGVAGGPNEDLGLFTADGLPTDNLAKAMANMAAVEIGPAHPREALIKAAVAQLRQTLGESDKHAAGAPAPATETSAPPSDQERAISSSARP